MRKRLFRWSAPIFGFLVFYLLVGTIVGRQIWTFIEENIPAEDLRAVINLLGARVGLEKITSIDSRLAAIEKIVDYVTFPWALFGGVCGALIVEIALRALARDSAKD